VEIMNLLLAVLLLIGPQLVGSEFTYDVRPGDSFTSIGARFGIDVRVIAAENALNVTSSLQPGQHLKLDNRHIVPDSLGADIIVNVPQRMLFQFDGGDLSAHFPVAVGRASWPTPRGAFEIVSAEEDPVWDVPPSIQAEMARQGKPVLTHVPPSPANPLGKYWLGLNLPGIGIHGTNAPFSIYSVQTHGCIRLHPDDIEELFGKTDVGTTGQIIYEPVLMMFDRNLVFLEVHPDVYKLRPKPAEFVRSYADSNHLLDVIDWELVMEVIGKRDGIAREVSKSVLPHAKDVSTTR
jgi:L,D-transpeptidase ErfK/SrfK